MTRTLRRRARAAAVLLAYLAPVACRDAGATDPPLPADAVRVTPPAVYARWWAQTEVCSGLTGDLAAVQWYVVPGADSVPRGAGRRDAAAYWSSASNRVVLASHVARDGGTVRHEMLHALLGPAATGHPPAYFQGRCDGWVECPAVGCADEGSPPPAAPADAAVLPASALPISVELLPSVVRRVPGDSGVTVVVRVTNPRPEPVWVELASPFQCEPCADYNGFGFNLDSPGGTGTQYMTAVRRFALSAGGSKLRAIDWDLANYPVGTYQVGGTFNYDSSLTRAALRIGS